MTLLVIIKVREIKFDSGCISDLYSINGNKAELP